MARTLTRWAETPLQTDRPGVVLPFPAAQAAPERPRLALSAAERERLDRLRTIARDSRLAARPECMIACARRPEPETGCGGPCAAEQFRLLREVGGRRLTLYRPGAAGVSEDEHWLLRLTAALSADDLSMARGLVAFRIAKPQRRALLAVASTVALCVDRLACATKCAS